jgi:hypothetical protein
MNRLILIGNGFDLAHGMKTGYVDFIKWYIATCTKVSLTSGEYDDALIHIIRNENYPDYPSEKTIEEWVENCYQGGFDLNRLGTPRHSDNAQWRNTLFYPFTVTQKSTILIGILADCSLKRWVDVEAVFYSVLMGVLNGDQSTSGKEKLLEEINLAMNELTKQLEAYLSSLPEPPLSAAYTSILDEYIRRDELELTRGEPETPLFDERGISSNQGKPDHTMILNFNYTRTIELYISDNGQVDPKFTLNYIHGQLNNKVLPLVFGFGDEMDSQYQEMEKEQARGYFEHIKSFWYLKNSNYRELVRFVNRGHYQIVILGHSCGLSDRTMLHMLMEHGFCKSIKLYYHGTPESNNYTDTTYDIARHFDNKTTLRDRVLPKDKSTWMPQVKR